MRVKSINIFFNFKVFYSCKYPYELLFIKFSICKDKQFFIIINFKIATTSYEFLIQYPFFAKTVFFE